jgi:hypothetical protein
MVDSDQDSIERLKRKLYGRTNAAPPVRRSALEEREPTLPREWSAANNNMASSKFLSPNWLKKLLLIAVVFFVLMIGVTVFVFMRGENVVSSSNVVVDMTGPLSVRSGQAAAIEVTITNKNAVAMELVDLIAEYPAGTKSSATSTRELTYEKQSIGTIKSGEMVRQILRPVLFGQKDADLPIQVTAQYRLANSNATFHTSKTLDLSISSSPIDVTLDLPETVNANQEVTAKVTIVSNAASPISAPLVVMNYPSGFEFRSSSLTPTYGRNVWLLDPLKPGDKVTFVVKGVIAGQDAEDKAFRIEVGSGRTITDTVIAVSYGTVTKQLTIERASVGLGALINNSSENVSVAESRQQIQGKIDWRNNLATPVTDAEITIEFKGDALDKSSVLASRGFYDSATNLIRWNRSSYGELGSIQPGTDGSIDFSFSPVSLVSANNYQIKNPRIDLTITLRGKRVAEGGGTEPVETTLTRSVKLNSVVQLAAKANYATGPLANRGPLPPKVDQETTYTITWSLLNSSNNLSESFVTAVLPPYVSWTNSQSPANENLTFTPASGGGGQVVWSLGTISAATGFGTAPRQVSFQVALKPSLSQVGTIPNLVSEPTFTAIDGSTGQTLETTFKRPLDTNLNTDPQFQLGQEKVVK